MLQCGLPPLHITRSLSCECVCVCVHLPSPSLPGRHRAQSRARAVPPSTGCLFTRGSIARARCFPIRPSLPSPAVSVSPFLIL